MSDFSSIEGQVYISIGTIASTGLINLGNYGDVSGLTKGTWANLISSTPYDSDGFILQVDDIGQVSRTYSIDVGLGKPNGTAFLLQSFTVGSQSGAPNSFFFPLSIPSNSQISLRFQADTNTSQLGGVVLLGKFSFLPSAGFNRSETWGSSSSIASMTTVDAGAVANTKGTWVQLKASSNFHTKAIIINAQRITSFSANSMVFLDIGIGPSGSENVIISDLPFLMENNVFSTGIISPSYYGPFLVDIPAGSRITARSQCASTTSSLRQIGVEIIAFS